MNCKNMSQLSVGDIARRCGVKVSTLHFYEQKGLIASSRNNGNQRRYGRETIRRVSLIKAAKQMGISLGEIADAFGDLPTYGAPTREQWQEMATAWGTKLEARITRLTKLKDSLMGCIGCGCLSMKNCPLYNPDDSLAEHGPGPVLLKANTDVHT